MSDLKKDLNEIAPPKPKKVIRQKAKKSVTQILARTRKKVAKAEQSLRSAKRHAENTKNKLLTIRNERVLPFFMKEILPHVCEGKNVLVAAHGNSLRSLIKFLDNISDEDIVKLEIPTGAPIHYVINEDGSVKSKKDFFNE